MNGKKAKKIRKVARAMTNKPTMWRRIPQNTTEGYKPDAQVICSPGSFKDTVKQLKNAYG